MAVAVALIVSDGPRDIVFKGMRRPAVKGEYPRPWRFDGENVFDATGMAVIQYWDYEGYSIPDDVFPLIVKAVNAYKRKRRRNAKG